MKSAVVILLLVALAVADYDVKWNCGACSTSSLGKNCFSINGGPFNSYEVTIDKEYISCQDTGLFFPLVFTFTFRDKCKGCGIDISMGDLLVKACTEDQDGTNAVTSLNRFYAMYTNNPGATFNWCGDISPPTDQALVTIVSVGAIVVAGLIVGIALHYKQKDKVESTLTEYVIEK